MNKAMPIDRFTGDYAFLSNRYPRAVQFENVTYLSVEHAHFAARFSNPAYRLCLSHMKAPWNADREGHFCKQADNWNSAIRVPKMIQLLRIKFSEDDLKAALLATGDATLINGGWWFPDLFWGVDSEGRGGNVLGQILMQIRDTTTKEKA